MIVVLDEDKKEYSLEMVEQTDLDNEINMWHWVDYFFYQICC